MAKRINYRRLALTRYPPLCVHCGFGIPAVLEVAHLDCDPNNCELENLAILCPTCHRMHDLDLLPTQFIIQQRDNPRKPRWSKLMKDAATKAVATRRRNAVARRSSAASVSSVVSK